MRAISLAITGLVLAAATSAQATVVYDNLSTSAVAGTSGLNTANPIFGDSLSLLSAGQLTTFGCSLFNSGSGGNTGSILTGTMLITFYDNTVPYASGAIANPVLGTATLNWDFSSTGGLLPGFFTTQTFDLSALNIGLTQDILVTQAFTQVTGTSLRNGVVLVGNSAIGSSPNSVYLKSATTPEGLYTFGGGAANSQFAYQVNITPAPASAALLGLGGLVAARRRRAR